ncbi:MAG: hypothetical protein RIR06_577 [Bacteroidota bacterium]
MVYHYPHRYAKDLDCMDPQQALANWLKSQPQDVIDAFKRDFLYSEKDIEILVDSISK